MIDPLLKVAAPTLALPMAVPPVSSPTPGADFASMFKEAVQNVEGYRTQADTTVQRFLTGEQEDVHTVAVATQRAELSFELFLQVKNKAVQAYQEVMRMQL